MIDINFRGVLVATQAAMKYMPDGGRIISIGSCVGERNLTPGLTAYAATKGAVKMFTQSLAREVGHQSITVNNIQPGPIDTDLNPASANGDAPVGSHRAQSLWARGGSGGTSRLHSRSRGGIYYGCELDRGRRDERLMK